MGIAPLIFISHLNPDSALEHHNTVLFTNQQSQNTHLEKDSRNTIENLVMQAYLAELKKLPTLIKVESNGKAYHFRHHQFDDSNGRTLVLFHGTTSTFDLDQNAIHNPDFINKLTDTLPDMLWAKDIQGHYLFANKAICENLLMARTYW